MPQPAEQGMGRRDELFWAEFLAIEPQEWSTSGISYRSHVGLRGYRGFWCFRRNDRVVVSAPPGWVEPLRQVFSGWDQERLLEPASLQAALGSAFERSIGPAFQGCLVPEQFASSAAPAVRSVTASDTDAVEVFRGECTSEEWEASGLAAADLWQQACFEGDSIVAMAGFRAWNDHAGGPCVLTHPEVRGRGCGTAVARAVVAEALSHGKLLLYQTLDANRAAVRLALSLGYERYASHVAVRLRSEAPEFAKPTSERPPSEKMQAAGRGKAVGPR
jgi:GNAT superfamily N-acetyltransferase